MVAVEAVAGLAGVAAGGLAAAALSMAEASFGPVGEVSTKDSPITRKRICWPGYNQTGNQI